MDAKDTSPAGLLELPRTLTAFPHLRRYTLLFGLIASHSTCENIEWMTVAIALSGLAPPDM